MQTPEMFRKMAVHVPGITNRREAKRLTQLHRERLLRKVFCQRRSLIVAAQISDQDITQMADDILGGWRNHQMYYVRYGNSRPFSPYSQFFCILLRELEVWTL